MGQGSACVGCLSCGKMPSSGRRASSGGAGGAMVPASALADKERELKDLKARCEELESALHAAQNRAEALRRLATPAAAAFYLIAADGSKVPAVVATTPDGILFGELRARVQAAEFVGMRALNQPPSNPPTPIVITTSSGGNSGTLSPPADKPRRPSFRLPSLWLSASMTSAGEKKPEDQESPTTAGPAEATKATEGLEKELKRSWQEAVENGAGAIMADSESTPMTPSSANAGAWELLWKEGGGGGPLRRLQFEANGAGFRCVRECVNRWNAAASKAPSRAPSRTSSMTITPKTGAQAADTGPEAEQEEAQEDIPLGVPLLKSSYAPVMKHASKFLTVDDVSALAGVLPPRFRLATWELLYSTARDGIRFAQNCSPTVLAVQDMAEHVFGCYATDPWRVYPRYFGTGECFVFRLRPFPEAFPWSRDNGLFQFSTADALAMGGGGRYSLRLDDDLLWGSSGPCETFNNSCLASAEDFEIRHVELWGLA
eukprot:jgi/Chlat1/4716/Chrsp30S00368